MMAKPIGGENIFSPEDFFSWRSRLNLTQARAAEELRVSKSAVRNWEQGRRAIPGNIELLCWYIEKFGGSP